MRRGAFWLTNELCLIHTNTHLCVDAHTVSVLGTQTNLPTQTLKNDGMQTHAHMPANTHSHTKAHSHTPPRCDPSDLQALSQIKGVISFDPGAK